VKLGDLVTYRGRVYVLRGLDPASVPKQRAQLEDPRTGRRRSVAFAEVRERVGSPEHRG
jgi:hypothetical protein